MSSRVSIERLVLIPEPLLIDDFLGTYSLKKAKVIMGKIVILGEMGHAGGNKSMAVLRLELSYPALFSKNKEYED